MVDKQVELDMQALSEGDLLMVAKYESFVAFMEAYNRLDPALVDEERRYQAYQLLDLAGQKISLLTKLVERIEAGDSEGIIFYLSNYCGPKWQAKE